MGMMKDELRSPAFAPKASGAAATDGRTESQPVAAILHTASQPIAVKSVRLPVHLRRGAGQSGGLSTE